MKNVPVLITAVFMLLFFNSCNRKTNPETNSGRYVLSAKNKPVPVKTARVKKIKTAIPKVIVVNDAVATKTFDGRYYYDLDNHRYWRNKKDGKYYLYNKSMATDPDFKNP
jgi:hypothetical protein